MKVVFSDGSIGELCADEERKLFVERSFSKEEWQNLREQMRKLNVFAFEDQKSQELGIEDVWITEMYVGGQTARCD